MKSYKLSFHRSGTAVDLLVSVDPTVTVGVLAEALTERGGETTRPAGPVTLAVAGGHVLAAADQVGRSGLRSGAAITVVPASDSYPRAAAGSRTARLEIVAGPDYGAPPVWLPSGTSTVGRDPGCTVTLSDGQVSKVHARINITDTVEIVDNNSTNGTFIGGTQVNRARLRTDELAEIGDTHFRIVMHEAQTGAQNTTGPATQVNRSPRLDPPYPGQAFEAPVPPKRPTRSRFPLIALLAPLLVGATLFAFTGSVLSLLFVVLSPLMLVGNFAENVFAGRRSLTADTDVFRTELAKLDAKLRDAAVAERIHRRREHPSTAEMVDAGMQRTPLLWTRRPEHTSFLDLRLGLGTLPSRNTVDLPAKNEAIPDLWAELLRVVAGHAKVDGVPVVARFPECGALGIAGYQRSAIPVARCVVAQLVTLHSPAELVVAAVASSTSAKDWAWLTWLPHTSARPNSPHTPLSGPHLSADAGAAATLIAEIDDLIAVRSQEKSSEAPRLPIVILIVEDDADADRGRLVDLAERGPAYGVHVIWVASTVEQLPAVCRTFVDVNPQAGTAPVGYVHRGEEVDPVVLEPLSGEQVDALARALSPLVDAGARVNDDTGLPSTAAFLDLAEAPLDRSVAEVIDKWRESGSLGGEHHRAEPSLRGLIGVRGVDAAGRPEPMHLDLRRDGPHALVGGTTGAGKSELLQSWILGMATAISPLRVTFLFVDYKGGAAFGALKELPHAVGLVTDLSPRQVHRALTSLRAEVTYRERILHRYDAKDLAELEAGQAEIAPPRLVIVVDEFAALRAEVPEFVDGVVDIAQRGRSLGLHLILATQRPTGIITDSLRANTNLRIALRMNDDADSIDVLGNPIAAGFDPAVPGRAVIKSGPGRLVTFQAAYAGGWTTNEPPPPVIMIETLGFGVGRPWVDPRPPVRRTARDRGPNDVTRIVRTVSGAAEAVGLAPPRLPWQPELTGEIDLRVLLQRAPRETNDMRRVVDSAGNESVVADDPAVRTPIVFGRRDVPLLQITPPVAFYPDRDGNLAVYGTGGTGKSAALRTLALAALHNPDQPCHVYGIEYGGRGLSMLEPLPQVGSIVRGEDSPRLVRLMAYLRGVIERRQVLFDRAHADTIAAYWAQTGDRSERRILLLIDGMGGFAQAHQPGTTGLFEQLLALAGEGRPVGVHLIVSADRGNAVPAALASALQRRLVLRLSGENDYGLVGLRPDAVAADAPAGRGTLDGEDVQVAVYGGADPGTQHTAIRALVAEHAATSAAPEIRVLGTTRLSALDIESGGEPVIGLSDTLELITLRPRGTFLVAGPAESGRTTALRTIVRAILRWRPDAELYYLGAQPGSAVLRVGRWTEQAESVPAIAMVAAKLAARDTGSTPAEPVVVVMEGMDRILAPDGSSDDQKAILASLRTIVDAGHLAVLDVDVAQLGKSALALARDRRTGILLRPNLDHCATLQVPAPKGLRQNDFPAGRGLIYRQGVPTVVQVADED